MQELTYNTCFFLPHALWVLLVRRWGDSALAVTNHAASHAREEVHAQQARLWCMVSYTSYMHNDPHLQINRLGHVSERLQRLWQLPSHRQLPALEDLLVHDPRHMHCAGFTDRQRVCCLGWSLYKLKL